jgi:alcohol dehydrogenase class IV
MTSASLLVEDSRDYLSPRQVLVGDGSAARLGDALRTWGVEDGAVAVIADRAVVDFGVAGPVLNSLAAAGLVAHVFADIEGEPTVDTAERATDFARGLGAAAIVGVGGGSAMDVAKIVAMALGSGTEVRECLGIDMPGRTVLPLALVPTTTGTGAEVTRVAMLSEDGRKVISSHRALVPTLAVLDAELVRGLPAGVTASTGMDALAHAVEAFLSTNRSALSVEASLRAVALLRDALPRAVADGSDVPARRATLYGAHLAGLALNAGVVLGHSLAYTIANRAPLPHGVTCGLALPYCLAYNAVADIDGVEDLALALTGGRSARLLDAADWVAELAAQVGLPTSLAAVGIQATQLTDMATECIERYPRANNPVPFHHAPLTRLLQALHRGDLAAADPKHLYLEESNA